MVRTTPAPAVLLSPDKVDEIFPFHVAFGADWVLKQCGRSLMRACPSVRPGAVFTEVFSGRLPESDLSFEDVWTNKGVLYVVRENERGLTLRGQMLAIEEQETVLFIATPWLTNSSALAELGLTFDDFAIHDSVVDLLQVFESQRMAVEDLTKLTIKLQGQRESLRVANERLLEQERESRRLALVAQRTDNAVVLTSREGTITWINEGFTRLTGYTLNEILGRKPGSFLQGPRTDPTTVAFIRERIRRGEGFSAELVNYAKSGREYWVSIEVQPIHDAQGQVTDFMAIKSDITARKDNERRLAMQSRVSRLLAETTALHEALPRILESICRTLGWDFGAVWLAEPPTRSLRRIEIWLTEDLALPPGRDNAGPDQLGFDDPHCLAAIVSRNGNPEWRRQGSPANGSAAEAITDYAIPIVVDGHVWGVLEFMARESRDPDAPLIRILSIIGGQIGMFIRRLETEQQLRETNALQRAILSSAHYAIIATTPDGVIRTFTRGAEQMLGYAAEELVGAYNPTLFHDVAEIQARSKALSEAAGRDILGFEVFVHAARNGGHEEHEWTYIRKDGSRFPVILSVTGIFDSSGRLTGFLQIAADVTERKRAIEELRLAKEAAESASRAKTEFLTTISHEIRTPMNGVLGMTDLLLQTKLNPRQRELAEAVSYSGDALLDVINDVLDFSKIEAGKLTLNEEEFALRPLVDGVLEVASHRDPDKCLSLSSTVDRRLPEWVVGDPIRLRQILLNLVGNGVKFTEAGEVRTKVSLLRPEGRRLLLRFEVIDTGIGLSEEQTRRLFQPFVQADSSSARRFAGSGLGLAICRRLVELMGGRIGVQSKPGFGSTFWFEVPLQPVREDQPNAANLPTVPLVLIATEDPGLRESLNEQFLGWNIPTMFLTTSQALLDGLVHDPSEEAGGTVLLLDEPLLRYGGTRLLQAVRAARPHVTPFLLAKASTAVGAPEELQSAFAGILSKPVKHLQLRNAILDLTRPAETTDTENPDGSEPETVPADKSQFSKARILLAEDNPINRRFCLLVLEGLGARADTAVNGLEAVNRVRRTDYDIILMDCNMPELDGQDATRAIRQLESLRQGARPHRARIIALTANAVVGERERCLEAGMDDYLLKPLTSTQLRETLLKHFKEPVASAVAQGAQDLHSQSHQEVAYDAPAPDFSPNLTSVMPIICDTTRLQQLCDEIDAEAVRELAHDFLRELPEHIQELRTLSTTGPMPTFRRAAHSLKGSSASMGLDELAAKCAELEHSADANDPVRIQSLLGQIQPIADAAANSLTQWLMSQS